MLIVPIIRLRPESRVKNLGQPSWTSSDLALGTPTTANQLSAALAEKPNIICIWIGTNDLLAFNFPGQEESAGKAFERNIDIILRTLSGHGATLAITMLDDPALRPGIVDGSYASNYAWYTRSHDHVDDFARLARRTAEYNRVIKAKAAQYGAVLVDLPRTGVFHNAKLMSDDGLHPSSRGYQMLANTWLEALLPVLGYAPRLQLTLTPGV